jgi:DeoR family fructose operon transcriptional repressor
MSTNADATGTTVHPRPVFPEQRQEKILHILHREQFVKVAQLSSLLGTSDASIRRDLQALEEAGLLRRTHGGAVCSQPAGFEPSIAEKQDRFRSEKAAIARAAVDLVESGETILLDAGSTTLHMAALLKHRDGIVVVTNAVNIARELATGGLEITVTGGTLRPNTLALVGPVAETTLAGLHVDKLFLATNGVDLKRGLTTPNLGEAQIKRAMIDSARQVIVVTDHSKFGCVAFSQFCTLDRIDCLITDAGAPPDFLRELRQHSIKIVVAPCTARPGVQPEQEQDR